MISISIDVLVLLTALVLLTGILTGTKVSTLMVRLYHHHFHPIHLHTLPDAVRHMLRTDHQREQLRDRAQSLAHDLHQAEMHDDCTAAQQVACDIQDYYLDRWVLTPLGREEGALDHYTGPEG